MVLPPEAEEGFRIHPVEEEDTMNITLVMMRFLLAVEEHRLLYNGLGLWLVEAEGLR